MADIRAHQWEDYAQDEYRMSPRLTLTLRVRYSWFGQPYSGNGQLNNFDPALYDPTKAPTISSNGKLCLVTACPGGGTPNPNYDPLNGFIVAAGARCRDRAETFNLFNHTNFAAMTTNKTSVTFGQVTTANDARIMQLGLQLYF